MHRNEKKNTEKQKKINIDNNNNNLIWILALFILGDATSHQTEPNQQQKKHRIENV